MGLAEVVAGCLLFLAIVQVLLKREQPPGWAACQDLREPVEQPPYAAFRTRLTLVSCHRPPSLVEMPLAFSSAAILRPDSPSALSCRTIAMASCSTGSRTRDTPSSARAE